MMISERIVSCDACGEEWSWENDGRSPFCPGCKEIWHKAGQSFRGYRFTVAR